MGQIHWEGICHRGCHLLWERFSSPSSWILAQGHLRPTIFIIQRWHQCLWGTYPGLPTNVFDSHFTTPRTSRSAFSWRVSGFFPQQLIPLSASIHTPWPGPKSHYLSHEAPVPPTIPSRGRDGFRQGSLDSTSGSHPSLLILPPAVSSLSGSDILSPLTLSPTEPSPMRSPTPSHSDASSQRTSSLPSNAIPAAEPQQFTTPEIMITPPV